MAIPRNSNRFLMGIERTLSQKGIIKVYENIPIEPYIFTKFFLYNIHPEQNKTDTN